MRTFTNLAWPDDPYRASQQLYRRPSAMLVSFVLLSPAYDGVAGPAAFAVAYLPLHRTRAVAITDQTVAFGFTTAVGELGELAGPADLELMQARRHAAVLTGHFLNDDLRTLRAAAPDLVTRGLTAVQDELNERQEKRRGAAKLIDTAIDLEPSDLAGLSEKYGLKASPAALAGPGDREAGDEGAAGVERLGAAATERALLVALAGARGTDRYHWDATIGTAEVLAETTWDMFPPMTWENAG